MKKCIRCGKSFEETHGNQRFCIECRPFAKKFSDALYHSKNKEHRNAKAREWYQKNKELKKAKTKEYRQKNIEYVRAYDRKRSKTEHRKQWKSNKNKNDIKFKMSNWCRNQIYRCINSKDKNNKHTFDILGYTPEQLKQRLEMNFKPDMTWENYGVLWNIDHRKPLTLFNFIDKNKNIDFKVLKIANSLANLKPLYIKDNFSKNIKIEGAL